MSAEGRIIGIDLGTTNSCVAILDGDDVKVLANVEGSRTTPSVVAYTDDELLVGQIAKRQAMTNPEFTVFATKRLIGQKLSDPEIQKLSSLLPYALTKADNGDAWIEVRGKKLSPSEVGAAILIKMKEAAEAYLGETVSRAVITVPAYFDDAQRQATKDAGAIAGLTVERIINEPTAATLAYGLEIDVPEGEERKVAVYDLGGGTFDISILELRENAFEVLATSGDTFLGGEDFDNAVIDWAAEKFLAEHGVDLREDKLARQRLKEASEKAKQELSYGEETELNLPFIAAAQGGPLHMALVLTRSELEELTRDLVERTLKPCGQALEDAEMSAAEIDELVMVGGQTRMPLVRRIAEEFFGKSANAGVDPDEVVAVGAAIQGGILDGLVDDVVLLDVVPLNIGVETAGGVFTTLIHKGTNIPTRCSEIFSTSVDNQPVVPVHVLQGLREMARDCRSLAHLQLTDILPAPRGVPQIRVSFDIDTDGILSVSAQDLGSGQSAVLTVQPTSGLSQAQIENLVDEADAQRQHDAVLREVVELRNRADTLLYTCDRALECYSEALGPEHCAGIAADMEALRDAMGDGADPKLLRDALQNLEASSHQIYEAMLSDDGSDEPGSDAPLLASGDS